MTITCVTIMGLKQGLNPLESGRVVKLGEPTMLAKEKGVLIPLNRVVLLNRLSMLNLQS